MNRGMFGVVLLIALNLSVAYAGSSSCTFSRTVNEALPVQPHSSGAAAIEGSVAPLASLGAAPLHAPELNAITTSPLTTGQRPSEGELLQKEKERLQQEFEHQLIEHLNDTGSMNLSWIKAFAENPKFDLKRAQSEIDFELGRMRPMDLNPHFKELFSNYHKATDKGAFLRALGVQLVLEPQRQRDYISSLTLELKKHASQPVAHLAQAHTQRAGEQPQKTFAEKFAEHLKSGQTDLAWVHVLAKDPKFDSRQALYEVRGEPVSKLDPQIALAVSHHPGFGEVLAGYRHAEDKEAFLKGISNMGLEPKYQELLIAYHADTKDKQAEFQSRRWASKELAKYSFSKANRHVFIDPVWFMHIRLLVSEGQIAAFDPTVGEKGTKSVIRLVGNSAFASKRDSPAERNLATLWVDLLARQLRLTHGKTPDSQIIQNLKEAIYGESMQKLLRKGSSQLAEFKKIVDQTTKAVQASTADAQATAFASLRSSLDQYKKDFPYTVDPELPSHITQTSDQEKREWNSSPKAGLPSNANQIDQ